MAGMNRREALASKSITPLQLTNAYLSRVTAMNKALNAYLTVTPELARRQARALPAQNSRMWGIPVAHKDLFDARVSRLRRVERSIAGRLAVSAMARESKRPGCRQR